MQCPKYLSLDGATQSMESLIASLKDQNKHITHVIRAHKTGDYPPSHEFVFEERKVTRLMGGGLVEEYVVAPRLDLHVGHGYVVWVSASIPVSATLFLENKHKCVDAWGGGAGAKNINLKVASPLDLEKVREIILETVELITGFKNIAERQLSVIAATHPRLGEESLLNRLDPHILNYIVRDLMCQGIY
uniref:Uncharacterized protein n=1 Tax=Cryptomonas curvata TaxID=233186 RepID=A0A7S0LYL7_9CRYP|mmetsp:Transcript_1665/g.3478  ORF Transcript_1665/g.3478 Transcript_1665/m.3478 type:complete len:189 (+) Transcript_1665:63-629(+)